MISTFTSLNNSSNGLSRLLFLERRIRTILLLLPFLLFIATTVLANKSHDQHQQHSSRRFTFRLPGQPMERDDDDNDDDSPLFRGRGREFDLFDNRKTMPQTAATRVLEPCDDESLSVLLAPLASSLSASLQDSSVDVTSITATSLVSSSSDDNDTYPPIPGTTPSLTGGGSGSIPRYAPSTTSWRQQQGSTSNSKNTRSSPSSIFQPVSTWWTSNITPNMQHWPKIKCRMEPTTTLKLRKTFRPLKTIVRLGADFNTQLGVWQFKSSWEDAIIGGKITLAGKELQISKSWQLSVGSGVGNRLGNSNLDDLITRLRFRAAIDLQTWKAYARVGFRTERLSPINVMEGFTLFQQIPLDGMAGHVKLEIKANFALPEPEIEYSTENNFKRSPKGGGFVGAAAAHMGDIEINIDEFNLLLDY